MCNSGKCQDWQGRKESNGLWKKLTPGSIANDKCFPENLFGWQGIPETSSTVPWQGFLVFPGGIFIQGKPPDCDCACSLCTSQVLQVSTRSLFRRQGTEDKSTRSLKVENDFFFFELHRRKGWSVGERGILRCPQ